MIQPHLPIRLPCYDFTPVISPAFGGSLPLLCAILGALSLQLLRFRFCNLLAYKRTHSIRSFVSTSFVHTRGWVTDFGHYRLPWCDGRCVQDPGTYSPQHSDLRLLAIPASCRRVAACNPNWVVIFGICSGSLLRLPLLTTL